VSQPTADSTSIETTPNAPVSTAARATARRNEPVTGATGRTE
jgi:hypothetical protein